jgi:hypothetical protein
MYMWGKRQISDLKSTTFGREKTEFMMYGKCSTQRIRPMQNLNELKRSCQSRAHDERQERAVVRKLAGHQFRRTFDQHTQHPLDPREWRRAPSHRPTPHLAPRRRPRRPWGRGRARAAGARAGAKWRPSASGAARRAIAQRPAQ